MDEILTSRAAGLLPILLTAFVLMWILWLPGRLNRALLATGTAATSSITLWTLGLSAGYLTLCFCGAFGVAAVAWLVHQLVLLVRETEVETNGREG